MSDNKRGLVNAGIVLAVLALAVTGFVTDGFGLFADGDTPPQDTAAPEITLRCDEWRGGLDVSPLGSVDTTATPPIPDEFRDGHGDGFLGCAAVVTDAGTVQIGVSAYPASLTEAQVDDARWTTFESLCGGSDRSAPETRENPVCADPAENVTTRELFWSGVRGHFAVVVQLREVPVAHLADLATQQSTTPDALLAATAAQVGQAVLARL